MSQHKCVGFKIFGAPRIFAMQRIVARECMHGGALWRAMRGSPPASPPGSAIKAALERANELKTPARSF
jgi:hypothetical protein